MGTTTGKTKLTTKDVSGMTMDRTISHKRVLLTSFKFNQDSQTRLHLKIGDDLELRDDEVFELLQFLRDGINEARSVEVEQNLKSNMMKRIKIAPGHSDTCAFNEFFDGEFSAKGIYKQGARRSLHTMLGEMLDMVKAAEVEAELSKQPNMPSQLVLSRPAKNVKSIDVDPNTGYESVVATDTSGANFVENFLLEPSQLGPDPVVTVVGPFCDES